MHPVLLYVLPSREREREREGSKGGGWFKMGVPLSCHIVAFCILLCYV